MACLCFSQSLRHMGPMPVVLPEDVLALVGDVIFFGEERRGFLAVSHSLTNWLAGWLAGVGRQPFPLLFPPLSQKSEAPSLLFVTARQR